MNADKCNALLSDGTACPNKATHGVYLRFWAKGVSRHTHQPAMSGAPVVCVCADHQQHAKDSEWYGPQQRASLRSAMRLAGKAEPDFDTADVVVKPL